MPIIPSVFQPIRANDFQQRPVKTYKHYKVLSSTFSNTDGYFRHNAVYRKHVPHIDSNTGQGVGNRSYPINSDDNTNQHVMWNAVNHKYYRNHNPAESADFLSINTQQRFLWHSASLFTAPYGQVGEKIKHGTFDVSSSIGGSTIYLHDDGNGNLIDPIIDTTTFASSSRNFFYMSFNNLYRKFNDSAELGTLSKGITYSLSKVEKAAIVNNLVEVGSGIQVTSSVIPATDSGLSISLTNELGSNVRIPHHDKFDRFGRCDDWTISFWHKHNDNSKKSIMTKWGIKEETFLDSVDGKRKLRSINYNPVGSTNLSLTTATKLANAGIRTPIHITSTIASNAVVYNFAASDGKKASQASSGAVTGNTLGWHHICVRNSGSKLDVFVNGITGSAGNSATLPDFTSNAADIVIGNTNTDRNDGIQQSIAEIRMYDYAVENESITSLGNNHYLSSSCYQTNIVGNIFHKNGQVVASSPLPKYNSGSGIFGNTWELRYRGTHTIYENECLVRVPKDQFNVTMNPTSTFRPVTDGDVCDANQTTLPPGELRKGLFVSGTLKPYITSIGLYNDKAEMLATAKLAQPIQKNPDIDMNFVVRWDY